jgi:mRNA-degrading endonuclease YafQ of YafQ-DinJ toxin-antitoxin module
VARVTLKSTSQQLTEVAETLSKAREQLKDHPLEALWQELLEHTETEIRHEANKEAELAKEEEAENANS